MAVKSDECDTTGITRKLTEETIKVAASCGKGSATPTRQFKTLTMNTGSAAALNKSYLASAANKGMNKSGVIIIRLVTATKTALFSPGLDLDATLTGGDCPAGLVDC